MTRVRDGPFWCFWGLADLSRGLGDGDEHGVKLDVEHEYGYKLEVGIEVAHQNCKNDKLP